ncbi:hypothetical protein [Natronococcus roseus]|uniref:hypothetical protein n=1 Tax=Natronococcus roseus TaxID=1052014 RepID=UPI00374D7F41
MGRIYERSDRLIDASGPNEDMKRAKLLECPACGADLEDRILPDHLLVDHDPEDFGLSPLGEESTPELRRYEEVAHGSA